MGRMSREEFGEWRREPVPVKIDEVLGTSSNALIVQVDGDKHFVGKSQVENLDELVEMYEEDPSSTENETMYVPRWLAQDNGWNDDEPDE